MVFLQLVIYRHIEKAYKVIPTLSSCQHDKHRFTNARLGSKKALWKCTWLKEVRSDELDVVFYENMEKDLFRSPFKHRWSIFIQQYTQWHTRVKFLSMTIVDNSNELHILQFLSSVYSSQVPSLCIHFPPWVITQLLYLPLFNILVP